MRKPDDLPRTRLSIICFAGSLLSKQTLVTLPFVLLLLDYWPLKRLASGPHAARTDAGQVDPGVRTSGCVEDMGRLWLEKLPFFVISAAFCIVAFWAQSQGHSVRSFPRVAAVNSSLERDTGLWPISQACCFSVRFGCLLPASRSPA